MHCYHFQITITLCFSMNCHFLTFFWGGMYFYHTLLWECITITHWCFGIYYYHFLTFWNVLVYCHFLVFLESISTNFDVLEYTITLQCFMTYWYYFLAFWNAFLPLHDHYHSFRMNCHSVVLGCTSTSYDILEFITKCITTTFQGFGIYYYRFLMFWNVLQLSDVLECITSTFRRFGSFFFWKGFLTHSHVLECTTTTFWCLRTH